MSHSHSVTDPQIINKADGKGGAVVAIRCLQFVFPLCCLSIYLLVIHAALLRKRRARLNNVCSSSSDSLHGEVGLVSLATAHRIKSARRRTFIWLIKNE